MPTHSGRVKRTKTFTGCLTCRSRGVKCDELRPACLRCRHASLHCKGYGITLTWPGCKIPKGIQRILLLDGSRPVRVMSDESISRALDRLDIAPRNASRHVGPFGVFPTSANQDSSALDKTISNCESSVESDVYIPKGSETYTDDSQALVSFQSAATPSQNELENSGILEINHDNVISILDPKAPPYKSIIPRSLITTSPFTSLEEQHLMHYWTSFLGYFMLPITTPTNPFLTILLPLALTSSNKALLHSIYTISAASHANLQSIPHEKRITGAKHQQLSIRHLMQSISSEDREFPEGVLATIVLLVVASIINGETTDWRVHMRGASTWIQSIPSSSWKRNRDAALIYQLFLCMEALRPAHSSLALDLQPRELSPHDQEHLGQVGEYFMDDVFCIPPRILEAIIQINRWVYLGRQPPNAELDALELRIVRSDPTATQLGDPSNMHEKMMWHNTCLWYNATYIYFKRSLQKLPLRNVEHLVRQSIEHLDAIALLEIGQIVSGIMWPAFMTGCEADDVDSRARIEVYFDNRETLGIGNVKDARMVVQEVWKRRDENREVDISWHEVMADLGINISIS